MRYLLLILSITNTMSASSAVTYNMNRGRLGDKLVAFCHAKWISYKYDIPLLYKPFPRSEDFAFSRKYHPASEKGFKNVVHFKSYDKKRKLSLHKNDDTLYGIPYFPEAKHDIYKYDFFHFDVNWKDPVFKQQLKEDLRPLVPIEKLKLPEDRITVALHVRRGGGHDPPLYQRGYPDKTFPLKFPPHSFFVQYIKEISQMFNDAPIYVHLFTDDENPQKIIAQYKKLVNKANITWGYREEGNHHARNVLDDFYALTQFDCLIRGESNFSIIASKLGDYKVLVHPTNFRWEGHTLTITKAHVERS